MLIALVKERVSFVKDIWEETDFFFIAPEAFDPQVIKKRWTDDSPGILGGLSEELDKLDNFSVESTEKVVKEWIEKKGYNTGAVMTVLRLAIVGSLRGPHIFDIIGWLGKEETLKRIAAGVNIIGNQKP